MESKKKTPIKTSHEKPKARVDEDDEDASESEEEFNGVFEPEKEREKMRDILNTIPVDDDSIQHATASFDSDEEKTPKQKKESKKRKLKDTKPSKNEQSDEENANESTTKPEEEQSDEEMQEVEDESPSEKEEVKEQPKQIEKKPQKNTENTFRDYYVSEVTDAFGDDLEKIRKEDKDFTAKKLSVLVDCLESGVNIFSKEEKELFVNYLRKKEKK